MVKKMFSASGKTLPGSVSELISGKWQSLLDKKEVWEFKAGNLTMYYVGTAADKVTYRLSNSCKQPDGPPVEKEKYITTGDDLCYYIIHVTATRLSLSYIGRGNTLSFRRIK